MTKIYLIRHAEADGNIFRRISGHYDGYVTENGHRQIEALGKRFADIHVDAVYSSDLYRTRVTAKTIYENRDIPHFIRPALREISFGIWENLPWGEAARDYPEEFDAWQNAPHNFKLEGAETFDQVCSRAKAELDRIVLENPGKTVAVVSHGATIRALLSFIEYGDILHLNDTGWAENTSVSYIEVDVDLNYSIVYKNSAEHLDGLSSQRWWLDEENQLLLNLWFREARFPEDMQKACEYHKKAWKTIFGGEVSPLSSKLLIEHLNSTCRGAVVFVYQCDRELGMMMLDASAQLVPGGGHMALLYLEPELRLKGLGVQLLGYATSVYRDLGRKFLTVRVAAHNAPARAFYKKHGFTEFGREDDGETLQILMKKPIYFELKD